MKLPGAGSLSPDDFDLGVVQMSAGLEWDSSRIINAIEYARKVIPSAAKGFRELTNRFWHYKPVASAPFPADVRAFVRHADKLKYLAVSSIEVPCPQGINAKYLDYLDAFLPSCNHVVDGWKVLCDYSTFIAKVVALPEQQKETSGKFLALAILTKERDKLNEIHGKCFKRNALHQQYPYGKLVSRNGEWTEVVAEIEKAGAILDKVNRKDLDAKVKELADNLDRLADLQRNGKLESITPEVVREIAEGTYQMAAEVEFYAVTYYRYLALRQAVVDTFSQIQDIKE